MTGTREERVFAILHTMVLNGVVLKRRVTLDDAGNREENATGIKFYNEKLSV